MDKGKREKGQMLVRNTLQHLSEPVCLSVSRITEKNILALIYMIYMHWSENKTVSFWTHVDQGADTQMMFPF